MNESLAELRIPARRPMMLVLRLTTAGVLTRCAMGVDRLDDAKMAVEEAAACMLCEDAGTLTVRYQREEKGVRVYVTADEGCPCDTVSDSETEVIRSILEVLADGVVIRKCMGRVREIELLFAAEKA